APTCLIEAVVQRSHRPETLQVRVPDCVDVVEVAVADTALEDELEIAPQQPLEMVRISPQEGRRRRRRRRAAGPQDGEAARNASPRRPGREAKPTSPTADPPELARRARVVSREYDAEGRDHLVEVPVGKGQVLGVSHPVGDRWGAVSGKHLCGPQQPRGYVD